MRGADKTGWKAFASICLCLIVWVGAGWDTLSLYAEPVIGSLGITRTEFSLIFSILTCTQAVLCIVLYGHIEHKLGLRKLICLGGCLGTAAFAIWATMDNLIGLYVGSFLYGICCTFVTNNTGYTGVSYWFAARRGTFVSVANAIGKASGILCAMVVAMLIETLGWRQAFLCATCLSATATVMATLLYKGKPSEVGARPLYAELAARQETRGDSDDEEGITYRQMFKTPQFWLLAVTYLLVGITGYGIMGNLPLIAIDYGFAESQGAVMSVALFFATAMMVPIGIVCDKLGSKWAITINLAGVAVAALLSTFASLPLYAVFICGGLLGMAQTAINVPTGNSITEAFGNRDYSRKVGPVRAFVPFGVAIGPTLLNIFYDTCGSYTSGLYLFAALCAAASILSFFATRPVDAHRFDAPTSN